MNRMEQELKQIEIEQLLQDIPTKRSRPVQDIDHLSHLCPACQRRLSDTVDILFINPDNSLCKVTSCSNSVQNQMVINAKATIDSFFRL